ncbi:MAG: septum formation initiator family protein [Candidatus Portnoybacteria bacterium]|nr:septum formation initiator family protein [Candidatus Portnoybacteria bacterium]
MTQPVKNFIKKLLSSKVFLFFIVLALIGLVISLGQESYRKYQLTKEINSLKSEIERLEGKNQQMADLMEYFQEGSYLEKEARLKLNLKKPGEKVVVISQPAAAEVDKRIVAEAESEVSNETTNFWKWWEYFFTP